MKLYLHENYRCKTHVKCQSMDNIGNIYFTNLNKLDNFTLMPEISSSLHLRIQGRIAIAECEQKYVAVNQFIKTLIEKGKLRIHSPDKTVKIKCNTNHVGSWDTNVRSNRCYISWRCNQK
jgi:hypothetical protein